MKSKEELLIEDCVIPFHDLFKEPKIKNTLLRYPKTLHNIAQKLCEEAMAHASEGKYKWTDEVGQDYSDKSDQKTGSIHPRKEYPHIGTVEISGLTTSEGIEKNGAIRAIVHNKVKNRLDYFYFKKPVWTSNLRQNNKGVGRLVFGYNGRADSYTPWAENARVSSFKELALK